MIFKVSVPDTIEDDELISRLLREDAYFSQLRLGERIFYVNSAGVITIGDLSLSYMTEAPEPESFLVLGLGEYRHSLSPKVLAVAGLLMLEPAGPSLLPLLLTHPQPQERPNLRRPKELLKNPGRIRGPQVGGNGTYHTSRGKPRRGR